MRKISIKLCLLSFCCCLLPHCQASPPQAVLEEHLQQQAGDHLRHSLLNKFLYQLHDPKEADSLVHGENQHGNPLLFPLHRAAGFRTLMGLPPALAPSNGLLLPTPAQLPATFRLPATAMAQHKAFPMEGPPHHPLLVLSTIVEQPRASAVRIANLTTEKVEAASSSEETATPESTTPQLQSSTVASTEPIIQTSQQPELKEVLPTEKNETSPTAIDLSSFLREANLSAQHTADFMRILEAEVTRRLERRLNETESSRNLSNSSKEKQIFLELPVEEVRRREQSEQELLTDDEQQPSASVHTRLELKTVNTRLFSVASGEAVDQQQQPQQERRSSPEEPSDRSSSSGHNIKINGGDDYRQREQAEFDRLLGKLAAETTRTSTSVQKKSGGEKDDVGDDDLLLVVSAAQLQNRTLPIWAANGTTTEKSTKIATTPKVDAQNVTSTTPSLDSIGQPSQGQGVTMRQGRFPSRHGPPKNKFERLVEDYRYRLSGQDGQNGLNDLVKALHNAHIGFFDRTAGNSQTVKILRRID